MNITLYNWNGQNASRLSNIAAISYGKKDSYSIKRFKHCIDYKHDSILEFCNFTFLIEGLQREVLARITRHRIGTFMVKSSRHCPNLAEYDLYWNVNLRSLRNFWSQRLCIEACKPMRDIAITTMRIVHELDPMLTYGITGKCAMCNHCAVIDSRYTADSRIKIILLSGSMRSGKTEAQKVMTKGTDLIPMSFAAPITKACSIMFPETTDQHEKRRFKQLLGTDIGRNEIDINVWVNVAISKIKEPGTYVFDDCRFPNEYDLMVEQFGKDNVTLAYIESNATERGKRGKLENEGHESENHFPYLIEKSDIIIQNEHSLEDFHNRILAWMEAMNNV